MIKRFNVPSPILSRQLMIVAIQAVIPEGSGNNTASVQYLAGNDDLVVKAGYFEAYYNGVLLQPQAANNDNISIKFSLQEQAFYESSSKSINFRTLSREYMGDNFLGFEIPKKTSLVMEVTHLQQNLNPANGLEVFVYFLCEVKSRFTEPMELESINYKMGSGFRHFSTEMNLVVDGTASLEQRMDDPGMMIIDMDCDILYDNVPVNPDVDTNMDKIFLDIFDEAERSIIASATGNNINGISVWALKKLFKSINFNGAYLDPDQIMKFNVRHIEESYQNDTLKFRLNFMGQNVMRVAG